MNKKFEKKTNKQKNRKKKNSLGPVPGVAQGLITGQIEPCI